MNKPISELGLKIYAGDQAGRPEVCAPTPCPPSEEVPHTTAVSPGGADPSRIQASVDDLKKLLDLEPAAQPHTIVFQSPQMRSVLDDAARFARSSATVLLTGESGTGKELLAQLIHDCSPRADRRYVRVNCAALPETLMESELFGHEQGAFTGAVARRVGKFEWADRGTLLLDEISELPMNIQAKLLRVLEQEEFQRLGGNETHHTNVRVIATSNRELGQEVKRRTFRNDLYHRLNVLELRLPPLRERPDDIPLLAEHFVNSFRAEAAVPVQGVCAPAIAVLQEYAWPGNVRQLRNIIHRACVLATTAWIQVADLPLTSDPPDALPSAWMNCSLEEIERRVILSILARFGGNKTAAAKHLGVTARTLSNKLKRYGPRDAA